MKPFNSAAVEDEVREIFALVNASFQEVPDKVYQLQENLGMGMQKARVDAWPDEDVEGVYAEAYRLFEEQRFAQVLPLALHLAIHRPLDQRFLFMSGMVLQSLGDPLMAATFYSTLLSLDPNFIPAAYRLAECYATLGELKDAREIFDIAIDMGRGVLGDAEEFYELQRMIFERLRASH